MFSNNGNYVIIFNGEIYNFKELKNELIDKGATLKTTSDTEVILQLFAEQAKVPGPKHVAGPPVGVRVIVTLSPGVNPLTV